MPICSRCGVDQPPEAFSAESHPLCECCYQIELEEEAAGGEIEPGNDDTADVIEKEGVEQDMDQAADAVEEKRKKPIPLSNAARILTVEGELMDEDDDDDNNTAPPDLGLLDDLVNAIEARGYSPGFGLDSRGAVRVRLRRVFFDEDNPVIVWLTRPLVQALLLGETINNIRVVPLNRKESVMEGQTLLHWLVQWKLLQLQCGWRGHDDLVDLLIRAGADVNAALSNGCTPLFFAVKYGSVDTVRLLLEAGAHLLHRDVRKQTCLRNALPQANPYILQCLFQHGLDAHETFGTELYDGSKIKINAVDVMVTEFVTPHPDVSWATLGMPSVEDYARCILLFLKKGIHISPHYPDVTFFLGEYLQGNITNVKRMYYTRKIADLLLGQWLPLSLKEELLLARKEEDTAVSSTCSLCPSNPQDTSPPSTTLYCGHSFHRDCIPAQPSTTECPKCSRRLCRELTPQPTTNKSTTNSIPQQRHAQLSQLSLEQLQFECKARNLVVKEKENKDHCVQAIVADWQDFTLDQGSSEEGGNDSSSRLMAELSLTHTMISQDNYLWVAPSLGSVIIPIVFKGVPVMALLSTTSPYTMVSPRFVEQFGLQLNHNLQATLQQPLKFVRAEDDDQKAGNANPVNNNPNLAPAPPKPKLLAAPQLHLVALQEFEFALGKSGIQVQLSSAVQVYEPHTQDWPVGVVLGLDFLKTAAWCQVSVEVDLEVCLGRTVALLTSQADKEGLEFDLIEPRRANHVEEDFRYYSKDGKVFWTPLWHVSISKSDCCLSLGQYLKELLPYPTKRRDQKTQRLDSNMTECAWCCREFPFVPPNKSRDLIHWIWSLPLNSGMIECPLCPTFYCDEKCRQQALSLHSCCQHDGVDLSNLKSQDSMASTKKKLCVALTAIVLISFVFNSMLPGGELVQTESSQQNIPDGARLEDIQVDGIESEL